PSPIVTMIPSSPPVRSGRPFSGRKPATLPAEYQLQDHSAEQRTKQSGDDISYRLGNSNLPIDQHGDGDRRVNVATADAADGISEHDDGKAKSKGDAQQART